MEPERATTRSEWFPAQAGELHRVRRFVASCAAASGVTPGVAADVQIAVGEACVNVLRHTTSERIGIVWEPAEDHVRVSVRDDGVYRSCSARVVHGEEHGWGLTLMTAVMDDVTILPGTHDDPGTTVRMTRWLGERRRDGAGGPSVVRLPATEGAGQV